MPKKLAEEIEDIRFGLLAVEVEERLGWKWTEGVVHGRRGSTGAKPPRSTGKAERGPDPRSTLYEGREVTWTFPACGWPPLVFGSFNQKELGSQSRNSCQVNQTLKKRDQKPVAAGFGWIH